MPKPTGPSALAPTAELLDEMTRRLAGDPSLEVDMTRVWWAANTVIGLQTRALLAVEWCSWDRLLCSACAYRGSVRPSHRPDCPIDAALTACGLDTQEKRDAAREAMR